MKRTAIAVAAAFLACATPAFALPDEITDRLEKTISAVTTLGRNLALHPEKRKELYVAWDLLYQQTQDVMAEISKNKTADPADEEALTQAHECMLALVQSREYYPKE